MSLKKFVYVSTLAVAACVCSPDDARADVIDGNWCFKDGRNMSINGPKILVPSGKQIEGNYTRHTFSYIVPVDEPGGGSTVSMVQQSEEVLHVLPGSEQKNKNGVKIEVWQRCKPIA